MSRADVLWPLFALAAWTVCMLLFVAARRVHGGVTGKAHAREYALGESPAVPPPIALPNRNYMNLLELPVLFYVVCLMAYVTGAVSPLMVALAWTYVALRVVHSLVHVTYNRILHRFTAFAASNFVLVALWMLVGIALARGAG